MLLRLFQPRSEGAKYDVFVFTDIRQGGDRAYYTGFVVERPLCYRCRQLEEPSGESRFIWEVRVPARCRLFERCKVFWKLLGRTDSAQVRTNLFGHFSAKQGEPI